MLRLAALLLLAPPDAALLYRATIAAADGSLHLNETASTQAHAARFSPNGRTLAVAPMDNTVVFLNAP